MTAVGPSHLKYGCRASTAEWGLGPTPRPVRAAPIGSWREGGDLGFVVEEGRILREWVVLPEEGTTDECAGAADERRLLSR